MNAKVPSVASGHGHSRLRKLPFALLILTASIGNAYAQWNSASPAGLGVINFNSSDTRKIIFADKARSTEGGRTISQTNWNNYLSTKNSTQPRNFNSFVPGTSEGQGRSTLQAL